MLSLEGASLILWDHGVISVRNNGIRVDLCEIRDNKLVSNWVNSLYDLIWSIVTLTQLLVVSAR